ncbi:MAG: outer membrane lipoprotein carrier protein LolA [Bacteroidales bacterium]|jgi:outer membrane lipoprotein-sorting protein|nr:outer membrane lipoprotein carrier protein LolA [Bacteroidales bacterium]
MKNLLTLIYTFFFITALAQPAKTGINDQQANEILNKIRKDITSYKSLKIDFTYNNNNCSLLVSNNNYALNLSDQQIITNGKTLWMYLKKENEVNIYNYVAEKDELNPLLAIQNYEKKYRAKYIREGVIDLLPLDGKGSIYKLRIYIDKELSKFEAYDKSGTTYSYSVTSWKPNAPVTASEFEFDPKNYPNILINDMR